MRSNKILLIEVKEMLLFFFRVLLELPNNFGSCNCHGLFEHWGLKVFEDSPLDFQPITSNLKFA